MLSFLTFLFKIIFNLSRSKKNLLIKVTILEKEVEILKRKRQGKRVIPEQVDRIIFVIMNLVFNIKDQISTFMPNTLLKWQRNITKGHWTFWYEKRKPGRPPVSTEIKNLILRIKNDNIYIGYKKIVGELKKLGIILDKKTIWNILRDFRRKGKVRKSLTWSKFLKMQVASIYAMDFFTVDTMMNQRFYVYFIIHHKTREIIQFAITRNPIKEFVRQQLIIFQGQIESSVYMIHDRTGEFIQNYVDYGIKSVKTSVKAPNMNSICERWIGSVRREALDSFLIFSEKQLIKILWNYISYYNQNRPHQGIEQQSPLGYEPMKVGKVRSKPVLGGLWRNDYRNAA
jgi:hypothetical protein